MAELCEKRKSGYANWSAENLLSTAELENMKVELMKMFEDKERILQRSSVLLQHVIQHSGKLSTNKNTQF